MKLAYSFHYCSVLAELLYCLSFASCNTPLINFEKQSVLLFLNFLGSYCWTSSGTSAKLPGIFYWTTKDIFSDFPAWLVLAFQWLFWRTSTYWYFCQASSNTYCTLSTFDENTMWYHVCASWDVLAEIYALLWQRFQWCFGRVALDVLPGLQGTFWLFLWWLFGFACNDNLVVFLLY